LYPIFFIPPWLFCIPITISQIVLLGIRMCIKTQVLENP
jgi:hypothetical protein